MLCSVMCLHLLKGYLVSFVLGKLGLKRRSHRFFVLQVGCVIACSLLLLGHFRTTGNKHAKFHTFAGFEINAYMGHVKLPWAS